MRPGVGVTAGPGRKGGFAAAAIISIEKSSHEAAALFCCLPSKCAELIATARDVSLEADILGVDLA
jgi:hypothetical protein